MLFLSYSQWNYAGNSSKKSFNITSKNAAKYQKLPLNQSYYCECLRFWLSLKVCLEHSWLSCLAVAAGAVSCICVYPMFAGLRWDWLLLEMVKTGRVTAVLFSSWPILNIFVSKYFCAVEPNVFGDRLSDCWAEIVGEEQRMSIPSCVICNLANLQWMLSSSSSSKQ